ncbi:MAG: LemA family protein [Verrucomicrobiales bacterium]|jgi:LemA protein|nr:LemA family protein [Verrucomicrobiales bacterium]MDP4793065.1 LemA family protein [Verrucomicrobiales bacterium]MDP4940349.1 LemA family protein [Verrucomicrobiales bacterium]MDP5007220.1 LemA family protein [Verrucomicrobiales bacterium]
MNTLVTIVVIVAILVIPVILVIGLYNGLVQLRNRYKNAFAQIDVQLKRRYDLIPNLVETVKSFMQHERETLEAVIQARNVATSAREQASPADGGSMQNLASADSGLGGALGRLFALSESYPELRSNQNMLQLQEELTSTESKVAFARQAYNDAVMHFNNKLEMFPSNIIAGFFNFAPATTFEVSDDAERESVVVKF